MGIETIVRPVVFPNIRPAPAQVQAPAADPTKGICTIHGASGHYVDLPFSWSINSSQSAPQEFKRRVDVARVYQKDDDGNVNKGTFIDVEFANSIWMNDGGKQSRYGYARVQEDDNIEIQDKNIMRYSG